jgi:hypothetical protein
MPPDLVLDRQTKQQKTDANGERPPSIELVRTGAEGGKVPSVTFPGTPPAGIPQGLPVTVTGPMVTDWAIGDRVGLTFRAVEVKSQLHAETGRQAQQWCARALDR